MKVKETLEEGGAEVELAESGKEGTSLAKQLRPDVIILDVVLEDCDGIELCQGWQSDSDLKHTPVLLMSGERAGQDDRVEGLRSGAMGYLVKPFADQELLAQVNMLYHLGKTQKQLRQRARDLARSNDDLEQFAFVISNDLMEPIRMVSSYTKLLKERYGNSLDEEADTFINYAADGALRMQKLIQDLLEYSRFKHRPHNPVKVKMGDAVKKALVKLKGAIRKSKAKVELDSLPTVKADPGELTELIQNLISNAINFRTESDPQIVIKAERLDSEWQISVTDNGLGVEPVNKERIFAVFQRIHTREEHSGSGVGLAVCKRIVERHGGRIWVESEHGKGSTFFFTLPHEKIPVGVEA